MAISRNVRVVVACACDVILILEHAFSVNGQRVWPTEIRRSAKEHKTKMRALHADVNRMIPTWRLNVNLIRNSIPQLRPGIENIVQKHRQSGPDKPPSDAV